MNTKKLEAIVIDPDPLKFDKDLVTEAVRGSILAALGKEGPSCRLCETGIIEMAISGDLSPTVNKNSLVEELTDLVLRVIQENLFSSVNS